jgi:hypothetical protein
MLSQIIGIAQLLFAKRKIHAYFEWQWLINYNFSEMIPDTNVLPILQQLQS